MSEDHAFHRIVAGIDAFVEAENAINVALDLAERFGAEIELVHAVKPPHHLWPEPSPDDVAEARRTIVTKLEARLAGARLDFALEPHHLVVELRRHAAELILERAAVPGTDLIVLGRHRRRGLLDIGSTLRAVLSNAPCPVWVQSGPVRQVERILVPVDLSEESLAALRMAVAWARRFEARIHVLNCFQLPDFAAGAGYPVPGPTYVIDQVRADAEKQLEEVMADLDWGGVEHETFFVDGDPAQRILEHQDTVDLVMMGSHGRTGLSAAVLGNVADTVMRDGHVPVLAFRDAERKWLV